MTARERYYKKFKEHYRTIEGLIAQLRRSMLAAKKNKKRKNVTKVCTARQFDKFIKNSNIVEMHQTWVDSGFKTRLKPSVDRIDNSKGYLSGNMKLVTWEENYKKGVLERKKSTILCKDGAEIVFPSRSAAAKHAGVNVCGITQAIKCGYLANGYTVSAID